METVSFQLYCYKLSTTVNVRTGAQIPWVDPDLDTPPFRYHPIAAGIPPTLIYPPSAVQFVLEVVLDGLPLGEMLAPPKDSQEPAKPDTLRQYVLARLDRLKPTLTRELEEEIYRLAKRHLGERGWMIDRVEIEIGSLKLTAGFLIGLEVFTNYGAVRDSMERLHDDVVTYAIPAGKQIAQRLLNLDTGEGGVVTGNLEGAASAATTAQPGRRHEMTSSDPEVAALLKQILEELRTQRLSPAVQGDPSHPEASLVADPSSAAMEAWTKKKKDEGL